LSFLPAVSKHLVYWLIFGVLLFAALNWGLIAVSNNDFNLVRFLSMGSQPVERLIYGLAGAAGLAGLILLVTQTHPVLQ
jgi:uncharacterized membrane protein YuzA (DUF378 family)